MLTIIMKPNILYNNLTLHILLNMWRHIKPNT